VVWFKILLFVYKIVISNAPEICWEASVILTPL
jgi:hypothetical protein